MAEPIEVVFVAVGGYGAGMVRSALKLRERFDCRIAGAVDPHPERSDCLPELQELGVPFYDRLEDFYAAGAADLAVISSPIHFHCPQTLRALAGGSHVLCEKPLGATVQEARRMAEARDRAGRFVAIGYQWSFSDEIQALKHDIRSGLFGAPRRLKCIALWPRNEGYYRRNNWAGASRDAQGNWILDSPVNNACAHYLHNMFFCLGDEWNTSAAPVDVVGELYRAHDIGNFDTAALRCHTADGVEVLFYTSHATDRLDGPFFRYEFERAVIALDVQDGTIEARFEDGSVKTYPQPYGRPDVKLAAALEAVRDGTADLACPVEAASAQTLCMNGLHDSVPEIAGFPPELVHVEGEPGGRRTWVEGLNETMVDCYERGILPAEAGAAWSRAGREVSLVDYGDFPSGEERA